MSNLRCSFCMWATETRCRLREILLENIRESEICLAFTPLTEEKGE